MVVAFETVKNLGPNITEEGHILSWSPESSYTTLSCQQKQFMHLEIQKVVAADYSSPAVQKKQIKQTNKKKNQQKMHDNTPFTKCINVEYHAIKYHQQL